MTRSVVYLETLVLSHYHVYQIVYMTTCMPGKSSILRALKTRVIGDYGYMYRSL